LGIGASKTCQRLWEAIPEGYRQGHCFTDFWAAYAAVIPKEQQTAVGKETGESAHEVCLLLFLHRYNTERAILLK
jgi:insertion element IS1 protein InsB